MKVLAIGILGVSLAVWGHAEEVGKSTFVREMEAPRLKSKEVDEASGLAFSGRDGKFLWMINDSGAQPVLHLAGTDGSDRGKVKLSDATNVDWEDLSSFKLDGVPYLLVADTGDNNSVRTDCVLYVVKEPVLPPDGALLDGELKVEWKIPFTFEDGPRDCESVAVDAQAGKVILVSKRTKPPVVYELPLRPKESNAVAKRLAETSVRPPKGTPPLPFIAQPTGMDISPDGSLAAVVTYYGVFVFPRSGKEGWREAFAKEPVILTPHGMAQAESVAFSPDGKKLLLVSERGDDRIVTYAR
jgi:hypothetical protein